MKGMLKKDSLKSLIFFILNTILGIVGSTVIVVLQNTEEKIGQEGYLLLGTLYIEIILMMTVMYYFFVYNPKNKYVIRKSFALWVITTIVISTFSIYTRKGVVLLITVVAVTLLIVLVCLKNQTQKEVLFIYNRCTIVLIIVASCLQFNIYKYYKNDFLMRSGKIKWVLFFWMCIGILCVLTWNILHYSKKIETNFLWIVFPMGLIFLLFLPPMSAPDEECHFAMSYSYSNELLGGERFTEEAGFRENGNNFMFYKIPARITDEKCIKNTYDFEYVWQYPGFGIYNKIEEQIREKNTEYQQFEGSFIGRFTGGNILAYLPATIGITCARIIGLNGMQMIFLGRIFNFIFFVVVIYFALKILPVGKKIFLVCAMLPMTLEVCTSYSYDAILIPSTYLFVAYTVYLIIEKENIVCKDIITILIALAFLSSAKVVYSVVAVFLFLIPSNKFNKRRNKWLFIGLAGIVVFTVIVIGSMASIEGYVSVDSSESLYYTIPYILTHIKESIYLVINSLIVNGEYYLGTTIGYLLGWLEFRISFVVVIGFCFICYLSTFEINEYSIPRIIKQVSGIVFIGITAFIIVATVMWTPIDSQVIFGFQGRYLLEILPLFLMSMKLLDEGMVLKKDNMQWIFKGCVILNSLCIITVFNVIMTR